VYVATLEKDVGYYFSLVELVLIANLARVNLVVAAERESGVYKVERICDCTPGPFVCVRLLDARRMRTHYERLIAVEDLSDVAVHADCERAARAACEREAARMQAEDEHSRKFRAALSEQQQAALRSLPASQTDSDESLDGLPRLHNEERATEADEAILERESQLLLETISATVPTNAEGHYKYTVPFDLEMLPESDKQAVQEYI
jgi:hypothetical protein